jgi:hypothetical protein
MEGKQAARINFINLASGDRPQKLTGLTKIISDYQESPSLPLLTSK